jgi:hypothetical protein
LSTNQAGNTPTTTTPYPKINPNNTPTFHNTPKFFLALLQVFFKAEPSRSPHKNNHTMQTKEQLYAKQSNLKFCEAQLQYFNQPSAQRPHSATP